MTTDYLNNKIDRATRAPTSHASSVVLICSAAWGAPWLLATWSMNMLLMSVWPWILGGLLHLAASGAIGNPASRLRCSVSATAYGLAAVFVAIHWHGELHIQTDGQPPYTLLWWLTLSGGALVAGLEVLAFATRKRAYLVFAEAALFVWFYGPALPWFGEFP